MAGNKQYEVQFMLGANIDPSFSRSFTSAHGEIAGLLDQARELHKSRGPANTTRSVRTDLQHTQQEFRRTESAANHLGTMLKRTAAMVGGIFAVRRIFGAAKDWVGAFGEFDQGLANVRAVSGATAEELQALSKSARELGATTAWTAKEVTDAQTLLAQAGYSVQETIAALPGLLNAASADQIDLATATDIVAGTLKAFGMQAAEATRAADVMAYAASATNSDIAGLGEAMKYVAPVANALGYNIEQTSAAIGLLSDANIKGSQAGTVLRGALARLAKPAKAAQKVMDELGFSAFDAQGKMLPLDEIIGRLNQSTSKLTDQERAAAITAIFGQEAMSGILALMEQGPDRMRKLTNELYKSAGAAKEMADTRLDSLPGSIVILKSAVEAAKISIGSKLAPEIRKLVDMAAERLPEMVRRFERTWDAMIQAPEWKSGDIFDKLQIAWRRIIAEPFNEWWNAEGRDFVSRVGNEVGSLLGKAISATVGKALSFDGLGSLLATGVLAVPGMKVGRGVATTVKTIKNLGSAGNDAAKGVGSTASSAGLLARSLGLLANPIGLTISGIGILTAGVLAYRKAQEDARRELLNMDDALRSAFRDYRSVDEHYQRTSDLIAEYDRLQAAISDSSISADELAEARERLQEVEQELIALNPEILRAEDAKSDRFREQLDLAQQLNSMQREMARRELEKTVLDSQHKLPQLEREYAELTSNLAKYDEEYNKARESYVQYREFVENHQKIVNDSSLSYDQQTQRLHRLADEIQKLTGQDYRNNWANLMADMQGFYKSFDSNYEKWVQTQNDLRDAEQSFQALYDAQRQLIEMDLGGTLEDQAKKYDDLTVAEKRRFDEALAAVDELNRKLEHLPTSKKINVEVLYDQSRGIIGVPETIRQQYKLPSFRMQQFGDGGIATRPSIFGEAGPEIAIPLRDTPRSRQLLDLADRMIGGDRGRPIIHATFSPNITVSGGDPRVESRVREAVRLSYEDFRSYMERYIREKRRLSFGG